MRMASILDLPLQEGELMDFSEYGVPADGFRGWCQKYFRNSESLDGFRVANTGIIHLVSLDFERGYVFAGELQVDRDHEARMNSQRIVYRDGFGKRIVLVFVDDRDEVKLSGFFWEGKEGC